MARSYVPAPGTKLGPCAKPCKHTDCACNRHTAAAICHYCGKAIGYEVAFYEEGSSARPWAERQWVHALCAEEAIERERAAATQA